MQRQSAHAAAMLLLPSFNRHSPHGPRCRQSIRAPQRRDQSHRSHPAPLLQRPLRATLDGKRINAEESRLCLARAIANAVTEKFNGHNWVEQRRAALLPSIDKCFFCKSALRMQEHESYNQGKKYPAKKAKLSKQHVLCLARPILLALLFAVDAPPSGGQSHPSLTVFL